MNVSEQIFILTHDLFVNVYAEYAALCGLKPSKVKQNVLLGSIDLKDEFRAKLEKVRVSLRPLLTDAFDRTWQLMTILKKEWKDNYVLMYLYWETRIYAMGRHLRDIPQLNFILLICLCSECAEFYLRTVNCSYFTYYSPTVLREWIQDNIGDMNLHEWSVFLSQCNDLDMDDERVKSLLEWVKLMVSSAPSVFQPDPPQIQFVKGKCQDQWMTAKVLDLLKEYKGLPNSRKESLYHQSLSSILDPNQIKTSTRGKTKENLPVTPVCEKCGEHCISYLKSFLTKSIGCN